jgi:hypothetical protein
MDFVLLFMRFVKRASLSAFFTASILSLSLRSLPLVPYLFLCVLYLLAVDLPVSW